MLLGSTGRALVRGLVVAFALLGPDALARDDEPIPAIRFEVKTADGCPNKRAFMRRVQRRTKRFRIAARGEAARKYFVEIEAHGRGFRGKLTIVVAEGGTSKREMAGDTCREVADGLAIVIAVGLDPMALSRPPAPDPEPEEPDPKPPKPPSEKRDPPPKPLEPAWVETHGAGALTLGVSSGLPPPVTLRAAAHFHVRIERDSILSPLFHIGLAVVAPGRAEDATGTVDLFLVSLPIDVCPLAFHWADKGLRSGLCAGFEPGVLRATGDSEAGGQSETRPWFSVQVGATVSWLVANPLFFELDTGAFFPLVRDRFLLLSADDPAYETPPAGGRATIGAGARFW